MIGQMVERSVYTLGNVASVPIRKWRQCKVSLTRNIVTGTNIFLPWISLIPISPSSLLLPLSTGVFICIKSKSNHIVIIMYAFQFAAVLSLPLWALAQTVHEVSVGDGGLVFDPDTVSAAVNDQVRFTFYPRNHSVAESPYDAPCTPKDAGIFSGYMPVSSGEGVSLHVCIEHISVNVILLT